MLQQQLLGCDAPWFPREQLPRFTENYWESAYCTDWEGTVDGNRCLFAQVLRFVMQTLHPYVRSIERGEATHEWDQ